MSQQKPNLPLKIDIQYEEEEELDEMLLNEDFTTFILENSLVALKQAIRKNKSEFVFAEVVNYNFKIKIPKAQYKSLIKVLLKHYEAKEEYSICGELMRLESRI